MDRLVDVCLDRALEGTLDLVFDRAGRMIGHRTRHHDRMAMFLLCAHRPDLFRDARRADRAAGEALPPPPEPIAEAVKAIDPVAPADPAGLMAPDDLGAAITIADLMPGELPRRHRDPDLAAAARSAKAAAAGNAPDPLGPAIERALEAAKNDTWKPAAKPRRKRIWALPSSPLPQACDDRPIVR